METQFILGESGEAIKKKLFMKWLSALSLINFFIAACIGLLLRSYPIWDTFPLQYRNLLHAHSHFALGGWAMPVFLFIVFKNFNSISERVHYNHWRNIGMLMLISGYGMLLSFPFMGYKLFSIIFSTLSVLAGFYFTIVVWKALRGRKMKVSELYLKGGLLFLSVSAIGPFSTGPLIAMGYQGTAIYFNAIYFYLHFLINGFFVFSVLAVFYEMPDEMGIVKNGRKAFRIFNIALIPSFFLSVLWDQPGMVFNIIGGVGALLQLTGLFIFLKDFVVLKRSGTLNRFIMLVIISLVLKSGLQLISAIPFIAKLAFQQRSFIIAFMHLILLGVVSLFALVEITREKIYSGWIRHGIMLFLISFCTTESLMVLNGFEVGFTYYNEFLFYTSTLFPVGLSLIIYGFFLYK